VPILVGSAAPPPPPPPPPPSETIGTFEVEWVAPDGSVLPLCDRRLPWWTLAQWSHVVGAAPVRITADEHPRGGTRVRHVQPQPRIMVWPLRVAGRTHTQFVAAVRQLARAFTQTRRLGPGRIVIRRPDGTAREIEAWYDGGIDGAPDQTLLRDHFVLNLYCPDPYWRDEQPTVLAYAHSDPVDFYDPFASISSGQVLGQATVDNNGDVEAWPELTLTGPAEEFRATNTTTGESFTLTVSLSQGESVTVTTEPPRVRKDDGSNLVGALNWPDASLWALQPGRNDIELAVDGADEGTTVTLAYRRRWETP